MLKALIVEDSPSEKQALVHALMLYGQRRNLDIKTTWLTSVAGMASGEREFDVVFLDVGLPGMNGMDAAQLMRSYDSSTPLVFVTSLSQYAVKSYEVNASGYVIKPVTLPKIEMCMDRVLQHLRSREGRHVTLTMGSGVRVVPLGDIRYIELLRHDLTYHLATNNETLRLRGTIKDAAEELGQDGRFLRISSGCLVNMDCVRLIKGTSVILYDGTKLPLSRSRRAEALERFADYLGSSVQ